MPSLVFLGALLTCRVHRLKCLDPSGDRRFPQRERLDPAVRALFPSGIGACTVGNVPIPADPRRSPWGTREVHWGTRQSREDRGDPLVQQANPRGTRGVGDGDRDG